MVIVRYWAVLVVLVTVVEPGAPRLAGAGTPAMDFTDTAWVTGLAAPTAMAFLPDGRLLIAEKGGELKVAPPAGGSAASILTVDVCTGSEMGLLGIAPHPDVAGNGRVFLYRTRPPAGGDCNQSSGRWNEIVRVTVPTSGPVDPASLAVVLSGIRSDNGNHNGGCLRIGPDRRLYASVGETGIPARAQDRGVLEGKILRLELDGTVPADNPFVGVAGARPEVFAWGFRNPWRFAFDPVGGALWVADVGQGAVEELDVVVAGGNYGWPRCEGTNPAGCREPGDREPVFVYPHTGETSLGTSVTGGAFTTTTGAFAALAGHYVFGDFTGDAVYAARLAAAHDGLANPPEPIVSAAGGPVDVAVGPDGAVYYAALVAGEIRRVASLLTTTTTTSTTTTTVSPPSSTTTTTAPPPCADVPTPESIDCRLAGLLDAVGRSSVAEPVASVVRRRLVRAREAAGAGAVGAAVRRLSAASRRLASPAGRRAAAADARIALVSGIERVRADLLALRAGAEP